jgi:hypothetical protein
LYELLLKHNLRWTTLAPIQSVIARRPVLQKVFKGITQLTRKFISNPVLLLGGMALFVVLKVLTNPDRKK